MKVQLKVQKIICIILLFTTGFGFLMSLGLSTTIAYLNKCKDYFTDESHLWELVQPFNKTFVKLCIGMIILVVVLFITCTNKRRKYYISNYISIGISSIYNIVVAIYCTTKINEFKNIFLTKVDFESWKRVNEIVKTIRYTESTFWFDINIIALIMIIISSLLLIANMIWKIMLVKQENILLQNDVEIKEIQR